MPGVRLPRAERAWIQSRRHLLTRALAAAAAGRLLGKTGTGDRRSRAAAACGEGARLPGTVSGKEAGGATPFWRAAGRPLWSRQLPGSRPKRGWLVWTWLCPSTPLWSAGTPLLRHSAPRRPGKGWGGRFPGLYAEPAPAVEPGWQGVPAGIGGGMPAGA